MYCSGFPDESLDAEYFGHRLLFCILFRRQALSQLFPHLQVRHEGEDDQDAEEALRYQKLVRLTSCSSTLMIPPLNREQCRL